ncbi:FAD binding domain-containing protein [Intrasporangium sp.]|uniref:FAD binding domain-containing protein n=1 Tax=Intrasporangium sp. TaxID=1925024 RepID=UPI0033657DDD
MTVTAYWRPSTIADAFDLLERPGAVVLAGGTGLDRGPADLPVEVVDLQALDLDGISPLPGDALQIGAMSTLQALVDADQVPQAVREAARRERPSTLRALATVGGCIATGHPESELLAALLVHEAVVEVHARDGHQSLPLEQLLARLPIGTGALVTRVTIRTDGRAAAARTARTTADRAIVAVHARATERGRRVCVTGVDRTPVLIEPGAELHPSDDFRGASDYRRALVEVLLARTLEAIS